jgi:hypothetical protein
LVHHATEDRPDRSAPPRRAAAAEIVRVADEDFLGALRNPAVVVAHGRGDDLGVDPVVPVLVLPVVVVHVRRPAGLVGHRAVSPVNGVFQDVVGGRVGHGETMPAGRKLTGTPV